MRRVFFLFFFFKEVVDQSAFTTWNIRQFGCPCSSPNFIKRRVDSSCLDPTDTLESQSQQQKGFSFSFSVMLFIFSTASASFCYKGQEKKKNDFAKTHTRHQSEKISPDRSLIDPLLSWLLPLSTTAFMSILLHVVYIYIYRERVQDYFHKSEDLLLARACGLYEYEKNGKEWSKENGMESFLPFLYASSFH